MGRNYDAAVVSAGFGGISLGSTPTAMANMAAVAQRYGASHLAFIVVPLVCALFIDPASALLSNYFRGFRAERPADPRRRTPVPGDLYAGPLRRRQSCRSV